MTKKTQEACDEEYEKWKGKGFGASEQTKVAFQHGFASGMEYLLKRLNLD